MSCSSIARSVQLLFVLLAMAPLLRAQEFSPHVGTWAIIEEVNGKPGRGFQIDVQNDILVQ